MILSANLPQFDRTLSSHGWDAVFPQAGSAAGLPEPCYGGLPAKVLLSSVFDGWHEPCHRRRSNTVPAVWKSGIMIRDFVALRCAWRGTSGEVRVNAISKTTGYWLRTTDKQQ